MNYIHDLPNWPDFVWSDAALGRTLADIRHRQGRHLGKMQAMGFALRAEASLCSLTDEIVKSSAIEGEKLNMDEVRSSVARRLGIGEAGLPKAGRDVEGVVEMMLDATQNCQAPLSAERLFGWHAALFPTCRSGLTPIDVGMWRQDKSGPMRVVSGPMGRERVHFQAPDAGRLAYEMQLFLDWFNKEIPIDPVVKAGVAHLWFVTIHPFDDGNGRIARTIADMALARSDECPERFYSMSSEIEAERREYYIQLEAAQRGSLDITSWLAWFLDCLGRAIQSAETALAGVLYKTRLWQRVNDGPVNERQRTIINRMSSPDWQGFLNSSKYAKITRCSNDTALRDIHELVSRGILVKNEGGGRSTSYRLAEIDN